MQTKIIKDPGIAESILYQWITHDNSYTHCREYSFWSWSQTKCAVFSSDARSI